MQDSTVVHTFRFLKLAFAINFRLMKQMYPNIKFKMGLGQTRINVDHFLWVLSIFKPFFE